MFSPLTKILLLQDHALWYKKYRCDLSIVGDNIFKDQIDQNIEVYMDDMLVKSQASRNHIDNLKETFATLRK